MAETSATMPPAHGNWFAAFPVTLPAEVLSSLCQQAPPGLRWFVAEDIHLTVAFFGRFHEDRLQAVAEATAALPPVHLRATLGPLRALPSAKRFSALSFELAEGGAEAAAVMGKFHLPLMNAAGVPPDSRLPYPHITIARPHRGTSCQERSEILRWCESVTPPAVEMELHQIMLYGWTTDRSRRQFRQLEV